MNTKRKTTKITSLLLALVMMLSTFAGLNMTAFAASGSLITTVRCHIKQGEPYMYTFTDAAHLEGSGYYRSYCIELSSPDGKFDFSIFPLTNGKPYIKNVAHYNYYINTDSMETIELRTPYEDYIEVTMKIYDTTGTPKKSSIKNLSSKMKQLKVQYKKIKGVSGYQIQYSKNKNFKNSKKVTVKSTNSTKNTIKNL